MHILLVEDHEMNRDMLKRRLERRDFQVSVAVDGQEAIDLVESLMPDIILMDMSLPNVDGWTATRIIKANPAVNQIPIIGLTAHAMAGDRERCLEAGCNEYEIKPVDFTSLVSKIQALVEDTPL
ncbi:MAG TPA: response regulator [Herpetosiphon sp.]|uniref:Response regulator receiver protein n=1 Tax=Herpetosiphon aurantiacus (strain ATCC 23779 / DSM 785 / 114-95) TaxID=316274 RepID=A9AW14_HERA2|nr:response regulator [Herpetosiphon sp.]ABX03252.1 response regulator receiver protein [Herpetosiphon aurantiacus DSM 785]HBW52547.1 response regulator [Herpetosiphon sp.]